MVGARNTELSAALTGKSLLLRHYCSCGAYFLVWLTAENGAADLRTRRIIGRINLHQYYSYQLG
jgi:hypothetical protein